VLGSAHVQHTAEACATAEDAALLFAVQQTGKSSRDVIDAALAACEDALSVWEQGECEVRCCCSTTVTGACWMSYR
jgi:hypothetical protein